MNGFAAESVSANGSWRLGGLASRFILGMISFFAILAHY